MWYRQNNDSIESNEIHYFVDPIIINCNTFCSGRNDATSNLKQIPSEATDFPGNNQEEVAIQVFVAKKDTIGDYHVKGSIKNLGETTLKFVRVLDTSLMIIIKL